MGKAWTAALTALIAAAVLASSAGAGQVERFTINDEYGFEVEGFCDSGLTVQIAGSLDIRGQIVPHGRDRLQYYLAHGTQTETLTANNTSLVSVANVTEKDMRVTDLGGGRVEVLILATGNATLYDETGKAIARNPGQTRFVIVFDAVGNVESLEVVKESTGRSDDFCDAAVEAFS